MNTRPILAAGAAGLLALGATGCHYSAKDLAIIGAGATGGRYVVSAGDDYTVWPSPPAGFRITNCAGNLRDLNHGDLTVELYDYCGSTPNYVAGTWREYHAGL